MVSRRPFTGARIETRSQLNIAAPAAVAPSQGRGSKHGALVAFAGDVLVAPSQGRGSKHFRADGFQVDPRVAPSQGRGSKLQVGLVLVDVLLSPLHRGADRNLHPLADLVSRHGRPFTGARIET